MIGRRGESRGEKVTGRSLRVASAEKPLLATEARISYSLDPFDTEPWILLVWCHLEDLTEDESNLHIPLLACDRDQADPVAG